MTIFLLLVILLLPSVAKSQINPAIDFYPLHVGNIWQYKITYMPPSYERKTFYLSKKVLADTILTNGKRYFLIEQPPFIYDEIKNLEKVFIRIDSLSGIVFNIFLINMNKRSIVCFQNLMIGFKE